MQGRETQQTGLFFALSMESRIKQFRCGRKEVPGGHALSVFSALPSWACDFHLLEHKMAAALLHIASTSKARRSRSVGRVWLLIPLDLDSTKRQPSGAGGPEKLFPERESGQGKMLRLGPVRHPGCRASGV